MGMQAISSEVKNRYRAFWNREAAERALLSITTPVKKPTEALRPLSLTQMWTDMEFRHKELEHHLANTLFFGEAFPRGWTNFGPGSLAAMIGGSHTWSWNTVWFGHEFRPIQDWGDLSKIGFDEKSEVYQLVEQMTRLLAERSKGRYITGMTDLGGVMDILASLRGTENLLLDLYDHPDEVLTAVELIDEIFETVYDRVDTMTRQAGQEGMTTWMGLWCDKRYYPLQCDFCAMISPDAFAEFVLPSLRRHVDFLDHSVYHLDGAGELPHLDHLLSIDRLDAIQWVPGDGAAPIWDDCWFPYYERIQSAGKNLILMGVDNVENTLKLVKSLSHRGLYIDVRLQNQEEAEEVLRKACEWAKG